MSGIVRRVHATVLVKPGMKEKFMDAARNLIKETRKEAGCMSFDLYKQVLWLGDIMAPLKSIDCVHTRIRITSKITPMTKM